MCASAINGQWHSMLQICAEPAGYRHVRLWGKAQTCGAPELAHNCADITKSQLCAFQHCQRTLDTLPQLGCLHTKTGSKPQMCSRPW